jgi:hypothetical protein
LCKKRPSVLSGVAIRTCSQGHPAKARLSRGPLLRVTGPSESMVPMYARNMRRFVRAWRVWGKGGGAGIWQLVGAECPRHQTTAGCMAHTSVWACTKAGKKHNNSTRDSPEALGCHAALAWRGCHAVMGGWWQVASSCKQVHGTSTHVAGAKPAPAGHPVECKRSRQHWHSLSQRSPSALLDWAASSRYVVLGCSRMGA